jgi:hypothetical protein
MTATPQTAQQIAPPAMTVHATGLTYRQVSPTVAELAMRNPLIATTACLTREELQVLAGALAALADQLEDEQPASQLVLPAGAGQLSAVSSLPAGGLQ